MIDTHCHLTDPRLLEQLDSVLARAREAGVDRMVTIGTDLDDSRDAIGICEKYDQVRCVVGVHPNYTIQVEFEHMAALKSLQSATGVVAIGEIGLDYFHDHSGKDRQRKFFEYQMQLVQEFIRPVVIHSREATLDTLEVMKNFKVAGAVFHCFTGTIDEAKLILDQGYMLGFTGPITYKKNDALREVVKIVPMDRLLVETDAPYLTPEPMRKQKTNEPAMVMHTARVVGELKGISIEEVDRITSENARRFYQMD